MTKTESGGGSATNAGVEMPGAMPGAAAAIGTSGTGRDLGIGTMADATAAGRTNESAVVIDQHEAPPPAQILPAQLALGCLLVI